MKGCVYDNALAEAIFKVFKIEFPNQAYFSSLEQLAIELDNYGTLSYLPLIEFKQQPT